MSPTTTVTLTPTRTETASASPTVVPYGDLSRVVVYPNPFLAAANKGRPEVIFGRLPPRLTLRLYTLTGKLVKTLEKDNAGTTLAWDLRNDSGSPVASGVYLYLIHDGRSQAKGKVALVQ
ncbi:MAG: T9SS type A sorting domain-containing protein [Candidatus Firestonebacteria bacterium]|nr:T9SS type A sorting domain-containing protein [Candidatus Firestonebacteria bacterium]